ncbi:MAG TPA: hypothetical protein ENN51_06550 [candidate division WOR-3 bacterium]|uniref:YncE family protein n=1 Tax=candidate division WOR-3 bacterium TaxID=2052148 RepID=A0A7V0T6M9_UNCW3|nr:hypothetical protein [candidate division WOR-3 bacterium]
MVGEQTGGHVNRQTTTASPPRKYVRAKTVKFAVALTLLLALVAPALAQDSLNCRQVALWPGVPELGAEGTSVVLDTTRDLAFLGAYLNDSGVVTYAISIFDISDPSQLRLLSTTERRMCGEGYGLAYQANHLYLAREADGFEIWDVSDPESPEPVGELVSSYAGFGLAVEGDYAFLATLSPDLRVIDVSDPRSPVEVGFCTVGFTWDVTVAGGLAYVVDDQYGLWLVDISDPTSPYTVGSCQVRGSHWSVAVAGEYAYLSGQVYVPEAETGYVHVIDVSNPEDPVLVTTVTVGRLCYGVAVSDGFLYAAASSSGLVVYDISDPRNPVRVGHYRKTSHYSFDALQPAVTGSVAFVADLNWGLRVIEFLGTGVEEPPNERPSFASHGPTVVRGVLNLSGAGHNPILPGESGLCPKPALLLNASGRRVMELQPGENDVRHLAPGV